MNSVFSGIIDYLTPDTVKEGQLFEPYRDEASAILSHELHDELESCECEEDKQGAISDYLYDLYKKVTGKPQDDFVDEYTDQLQNIEAEPVEIPKYEVKRAGKAPVKPVSGKVINPSTGCKVAFGGRAFKRLVNEGLLNEDGSYTEEGQTAWDATLENRPKKIPHPTRKNGKINLYGDAYKKFISQGWAYNEKSGEWEDPKGDEGSEGSSGSEDASPESRSKPAKAAKASEKTSSEGSEGSGGGSSEEAPKKEMIPHPTRKKGTLVMGGRGYKKFISQGWTYDEDAQEWAQ